MSADLTNPIFNDETKAREYLEALRWPDGVTCPHCGGVEGITKLAGKTTRPGLFSCSDCRGQFSVTVGTVYERSHIPLHKWLLATHLMSASKKGVSAHQLHRMLGITYKSAWFMAHRIREALVPAGGTPPLGGEGKTVEVDETYIGKKRGRKVSRGGQHKNAVVSLVERGGEVRSFKVDRANIRTVREIVGKNMSRKSRLVTDEAHMYKAVTVDSHESVAHGKKEYGRGDVHTNTIEGFFSIFKRGMKGVYQHCDERHLQRYLAEFDFRYNNRAAAGCSDRERTDKALKGIEGKRLTYRRTDERPEAPSLG